MPPSVDQVVIFDTMLDARELRRDRAERGLQRSGVSIDDDAIKLTGDRQECIELLLSENGYTLLLSDMLDDRAPVAVGNVGARLLRAVTRHPDVATQVWRILWTQYDHPTVITDIEPYAHAFVWFDHADRAGELIGDAIANVLSGPPAPQPGSAEDSSGFRWFAPRAMTKEEHAKRWIDELARLMDTGCKPKFNDAVAAASILRRVPDKVTDQTLRTQRNAAPPAERKNYCESIEDLLERVRGNKQKARTSIIEALVQYSQDSIATNLTPDLVEDAAELMRAYVRPRELRYKTLLTEAEDDLARTLVERYEEYRGSNPSHGSSSTAKFTALDHAIDDADVKLLLDDPEVVGGAVTEERRIETLSYVICAYNDTARSLEARTA